MSDLVDGLRSAYGVEYCLKAADEIERLRAAMWDSYDPRCNCACCDICGEELGERERASTVTH